MKAVDDQHGNSVVYSYTCALGASDWQPRGVSSHEEALNQGTM